MADESTYLIRLALWLGRALSDIASLLREFPFLTEGLGLQLPTGVAQSPPVVSALQQAEATANKAGDAAKGLESVAGSEDELKILAAFVQLGLALGEFYAALDGLVGAVRGSVTAGTVPDAGARAAAEAFAETLAKRVSDYAIASAITERTPDLAFVLKLAGLLDWQYQARDTTNELSRAHVRKRLRLDRVKGLINDPAGHLRETIGWGDPAFDPTDFFGVVREFFDEEAAITIGVQGGEPFLRGCILVRRDSTVSPPGLTVTLIGEADADRRERTEFDEEWGLNVESSFRLVGGVTGRVTPPLTLKLQPLSGEITGEFRTFADRNEDARPFDVVGGTGGLLSISANNLAAGAGLKAEWSVSDGAATINPLVFANIDGLKLKIGTKDADSFVGKLLAAAQIEGEFDIGLEWQANTGLRVTASGGVEIALPIHKQLGPIEVQTIYLALRILPDGTLSQEVSTALTGALGPLTAAVDRLGVLIDLRFVEGTDARFGPFDLNLRFKPPNGVGLVLDASVIKGGGYLFFDSEKEEYAGALELVFSDIVNLKAIGLITTKMPDGSKGFSLLIIITAEFGTGIQLGFGFTLLAVGGLLGLNRTVRLQALIEGVRTGAVNSILFPQDVIANAPRIISDLRAIFPPEEGKFLIGPMAKLSWGTPTLISLSLGIIIEIPGNIAIVGVLRVALPTDDLAVLVLQANFAGAIEFDKARVYFFAQLFESRLLFTTIEGEMGVLAAFGADANFVVTVGGFHPQFNPPPLPFPAPRRISVNIANTPTARIRAEGYFAVTPNTRQFGARAELVLGFDDFGIQGHIAFDALFQVLFPFLPLSFKIQISASVSLKAFGVGVFSIRLRFALEGPTPYRAHGEGSISLLFFEISADFDETWGETRNTTLPPIAVMPLLTAEFEKTDNWTALPPASSNLLVSLRKLETVPGNLVLHPVGALRVSQKAVPLDLDIDRVGSQKPSDAKRFTLTVISGGLSKTKDKDELFAPAQFQNMDDADKLSRPAFQPLHGGIELGMQGQDLASGKAVKRIVRYEEIIIDNNFKRFVRRFVGFFGSLFTHFLKGSAITKSTLSNQYKQQLQPFEAKIKVNPDLYTVAFNHDNKAFATAAFTSEAMARDFMQQQVALDPKLAESLHVVPHFEINKAA